MNAENVTGDLFVEAVDTRTGRTQRVPAEWIDDPKLGRFLEKSLPQLALDGELPPLPADAKLADLRDYATAAGLDVEGATTKADFQALLEPVTADPADDSDDDSESSTTPTDAPAAGDNTTPSN